MSYYMVAGLPYSAELYHHGIKGQKWGVRRYQNPDGSLTPEGIRRYGTLENFQADMARKKERREAFKTAAKEKYGEFKEKYGEFKERRIERGQRLSEAGYSRKANLGKAVTKSLVNTLATVGVSSALKMSGHHKSAKVVQAFGALNNLGIWGTTAKNMYDYGSYRRRQDLSKGVR